MTTDEQVMENIRFLVTDFNNDEEDFKEGLFKGLFIARNFFSYINGDELVIIKGRNKLTEKDINKLKEWLKSKDKKEFRDNYYRLNMDSYILIFQMHNYSDNIILLGHFLENSLESRLLLLELRQQYLEEQLI